MFGFGMLFSFFFPMIFLFLALRLGASLFRNLQQRDDRPYVRPGEEGRYMGDYTGYRTLGGRPSSLEARVFKLANRRKGRITVSDVVIETGLGVGEAEQLLQSMVDNVRVTMEVSDDGMVTYEFPEILRRYDEEA